MDANGLGEKIPGGDDNDFQDNIVEPIEDIVPSPVPIATSVPQEDPKKILYPIHTVTPKQTLEAITKQYAISLESLKNANPGLTADLKIDQKLVIPTIKGVEHVVKKGDTLSEIAAQYGVNNLYHILVANNLTSASKIRIGQKLLLPNPTKDPNPKKINTPEPVAKKPISSPSSTAKIQDKPVITPMTLTYGTYSLDLKVGKGCRNFAW